MGEVVKLDGQEDRLAIALASAAAERVLPLAVLPEPHERSPADDGLRLVWLDLEGTHISKQQFARVLNEIIAMAPADGPAHHATRAIAAALETALHNPAAVSTALSEATSAVAEACGQSAAEDERAWQDWAAQRLAELGPARSTLASGDAPATAWRTDISSDDLPLFSERTSKS